MILWDHLFSWKNYLAFFPISVLDLMLSGPNSPDSCLEKEEEESELEEEEEEKKVRLILGIPFRRFL